MDVAATLARILVWFMEMDSKEPSPHAVRRMARRAPQPLRRAAHGERHDNLHPHVEQRRLLLARERALHLDAHALHLDRQPIYNPGPTRKLDLAEPR